MQWWQHYTSNYTDWLSLDKYDMMTINALSIKVTRSCYYPVFSDASSCFWWTGSNCHSSLLGSSCGTRLSRNRSLHPNIWASMPLRGHSRRDSVSWWRFRYNGDRNHQWWSWSRGRHCCGPCLYEGNMCCNLNTPSMNKWDRCLCCGLACRCFSFRLVYVLKGEPLLIWEGRRCKWTV